MKKAAVVLSLLLTAPTGLPAADLSMLYPDEVLIERKERYEPHIRWNFDNLVIGTLTPSERAGLGPVTLAVPLRGEGLYRGNPLAFYARGATIYVPVMSVKFFDDLTLAWAYFEVNNLSIEPVTDYLGMLKYRDPVELGGRFPPPLEALGVAPDAWKTDPVIDDISQKALKSALVWIMAHELGHIYFRHRGYAGVSARQAQLNEAEADRFANGIMRRIGIAPTGMALFFMAMAHFDPNPVDFAGIGAWEAYLASQAHHPLTGSRLVAMADDLMRAPEDFAATETDQAAGAERIGIIARNMRGIGDLLNDPDIQKSIAAKALATDLPSLQRWKMSRRSTPAAAGRAFDGNYAGTYVHHQPGAQSELLAAEMEHSREGDHVKGLFSFGLGVGTIDGIVRGDRLLYDWVWGTAHGRGRLVVDPATGDLEGPWGYADSGDNGGAWRIHRQ